MIGRLPRRQFKALLRAVAPPVVMPAGSTSQDMRSLGDQMRRDGHHNLIIRYDRPDPAPSDQVAQLQRSLAKSEELRHDAQDVARQAQAKVGDLQATVDRLTTQAAESRTAMLAAEKDLADREIELSREKRHRQDAEEAFRVASGNASGLLSKVATGEQHLADEKALTAKLEDELVKVISQLAEEIAKGNQLDLDLAQALAEIDAYKARGAEEAADLSPADPLSETSRSVARKENWHAETDRLRNPASGAAGAAQVPPADRPSKVKPTAQVPNPASSADPAPLSRLAKLYGAEAERRRDIDLMNPDEIAESLNERKGMTDRLTGPIVSRILQEMARHRKAGGQ